jgi:nitroreductase
VPALKKLVWRLTPAFTHRWMRNIYFALRLFPNVLYDARRYLAFSGINRSRGFRGEQAARITMAYHQIEKGLSYANPRPGFGHEVVARLLALLGPFVARYGMVAPATTAIGTLGAYVRFNRQAGVDVAKVDAVIEDMMRRHPALSAEACVGGTRDVTRVALEAERDSGMRGLFATRHSVRDFSGGPLPEADLREAVKIAQSTPSVCNRQAWRVHAFADKAAMARLLKIQAGSRGFGDMASMVLVVTCDLTCFVDVGERYQAWIDGGMFCMSLCLALHGLGYGACCLNWSKERADDMALRAAAGLGPEEQVIMLIAAGTLPESFKVAYSARGSLEEVLRIH